LFYLLSENSYNKEEYNLSKRKAVKFLLDTSFFYRLY
jgi:hypothetical protein